MVEVAVASMVRVLMLRSVRPLLIRLQLLPPSMLLNTPPPAVPTKSVVGVNGSIAIERIVEFVMPVFFAAQVVPLSVDFAAPPLLTRTTPAVTVKLLDAVEPVM